MSSVHWAGRLSLPGFLRGTSLEGMARSFGRKAKRAGLAVERTLRGGRVELPLASIHESIWVEFDYAVVNSFPAIDPLLVAFSGAVRPGQVVFDVGGFVGAYAIAAARRVGGGRVYTFEPAPESADLLRRHCRLNGVEGVVRVVEAACGRRSETLEMSVRSTRDTTCASGNSLRDVYPDEDVPAVPVKVRSIRLDDFVREEGVRPDLMKVDVEGADLWVLEGALETLRSVRPLVFLEVHGSLWHHFDTDEGKIRRLLEEARYEILALEAPNPPLLSLPDYGHALLRPL